MNPESELVDERAPKEGPSQLAAAVHQQVGRKLGLESRDSLRRVACRATLGAELELGDRLMATARANRDEPRLEDHLAIPKRVGSI